MARWISRCPSLPENGSIVIASFTVVRCLPLVWEVDTNGARRRWKSESRIRRCTSREPAGPGPSLVHQTAQEAPARARPFFRRFLRIRAWARAGAQARGEVAVAVVVALGVGVTVVVGTAVGVGVTVGVLVPVGVTLNVGVMVGVAVMVGVGVTVGVSVLVGVRVGSVHDDCQWIWAPPNWAVLVVSVA